MKALKTSRVWRSEEQGLLPTCAPSTLVSGCEWRKLSNCMDWSHQEIHDPCPLMGLQCCFANIFSPTLQDPYFIHFLLILNLQNRFPFFILGWWPYFPFYWENRNNQKRFFLSSHTTLTCLPHLCSGLLPSLLLLERDCPNSAQGQSPYTYAGSHLLKW